MSFEKDWISTKASPKVWQIVEELLAESGASYMLDEPHSLKHPLTNGVHPE